MSSSKNPTANTSAINVHRTPIPGVYIDLPTMKANIQNTTITHFDGTKTKFDNDFFSSFDSPKIRSSAALRPTDVPGVFVDEEEVKESTFVLWKAPEDSHGMFYLGWLKKDATHLNEKESGGHVGDGTEKRDEPTKKSKRPTTHEDEQLEAILCTATDPPREESLDLSSVSSDRPRKRIQSAPPRSSAIARASQAVANLITTTPNLGTDSAALAQAHLEILEGGRLMNSLGQDEDAVVPSNPQDEEIFLHVFVHHSRVDKLTLNTRNQTLELNRQDSITSTGSLHAQDSVIQCWRYEKGRTLRFVNCGLVTKFNNGGERRSTQDKTCHVPFPDDPWHASFQHQQHGTAEGSSYGAYNLNRLEDVTNAEHNVVVFPRFMGELVKILGPNQVRKVMEGANVGVSIKEGQ